MQNGDFMLRSKTEALIRTISVGQPTDDNDNSRLAVRMLLSAIGSPQGGATGPLQQQQQQQQRSSSLQFDQQVATSAAMKNLFASLRVDSGCSQRPGVCVLSGDLLTTAVSGTASRSSSSAAAYADVENRLSRRLVPTMPTSRSRGVRLQQPQRQQLANGYVGAQRIAAAVDGGGGNVTAPSSTPPSSSSVVVVRSKTSSAGGSGAATGNGRSSTATTTTALSQSSSADVRLHRHRLSAAVDEVDDDASTFCRFGGRASLSNRQFQTVASRLQLAVVRPPAELSLLVRLA